MFSGGRGMDEAARHVAMLMCHVGITGVYRMPHMSHGILPTGSICICCGS